MRSKLIMQDVYTYMAKTQYAGLYGRVLESGVGNTIYDVDGHKYLDFLAGASTACLGYGRADVIAAYAKTAKKLCHSCFVYSPNVETLILAKKLIEITPGNYPKKVMLGLSASDSIDGAIKASHMYTGRKNIVSFRYSYHGSTGLASQATGFMSLKNGMQQLTKTLYLDFPKTDRDANKVLKSMEILFSGQKNDIACIIFEPILGDGGNIVPPKDFWPAVTTLAGKYKIVTVADETQSGMGRTGAWWASEYFGISPDIIVMGKGLGGGYVAISACVGRAEILDSLSKAQHVFTLSGHPPSCAVATKIISLIEEQNIISKVENKGNYFKQKLIQLTDTYKDDIACEVRGIGLQIGVSMRSLDGAPLAALFGTRCIQKSIYTGYFGVQNEVLRLHPPLTITYSQLDCAIIVLSEIFEEYRKHTIPSSTYARYKQHAMGLGSDF